MDENKVKPTKSVELPKLSLGSKKSGPHFKLPSLQPKSAPANPAPAKPEASHNLVSVLDGIDDWDDLSSPEEKKANDDLLGTLDSLSDSLLSGTKASKEAASDKTEQATSKEPHEAVASNIACEDTSEQSDENANAQADENMAPESDATTPETAEETVADFDNQIESDATTPETTEKMVADSDNQTEADSTTPEMAKEDKIEAASDSQEDVEASENEPSPAPPALPPKPESMPKVPKVPENELEAVMQTSDADLSDEEQLQAILATMSPEERAEYESYCREQAAQNQRRQQNLLENYGSPSVISHKRAPVGLFIAIIAIVALLGLGLYFLLTSETETPVAETTAPEPSAAPVVKPIELSTYPVTISRDGVEKLYINGVLQTNTNYKFVRGRSNSIFAYTYGKVPYFKTFDASEAVTDTIKIQMVSDKLQPKGELTFRMAVEEMNGPDLKATLNGVPLMNFPDVKPVVVLGYPHILTVEKPGYGRHMHVIWPNHPTNMVTIPEFESANSALLGTNCALKPFPKTATPYQVQILFGEYKYVAPTSASVHSGELIEYRISHKQRKPLDVAIIPQGFGTLSLDTSLHRKSLGTTFVTFKTPATQSDLQVCIRRPGEVICPPMNEEVEVPSGKDWEVFGITGTVENPTLIKGGQMQNLFDDYRYQFAASRNNKDVFQLKFKGSNPVREKK